MMQARLQSIPGGAILFDADLMTQGDKSNFNPEWFEPSFWKQQAHNVLETRGGRGAVLYVSLPLGDVVLRHYRRGGVVARFFADQYFWSGRERTRSLHEFRLLAAMHRCGLPVPQPVAARYIRYGWYYRADLITKRILGIQTLAQKFAESGFDNMLAERVGKCIASFHARGVYHADLNAHNILLDDHSVWLIDFDRSEIRKPTTIWRNENLARLQRSLHKLSKDSGFAFMLNEEVWEKMVSAYQAEFDRNEPVRLLSNYEE